MSQSEVVKMYCSMLSLQLPFNAEELKLSYRKIMKEWHPDRNPDRYNEATEKAKEINEAFQYLSEKLEHSGSGFFGDSKSTKSANTTRENTRPNRRYEGKPYSEGFPDKDITEYFVKSSHIISVAYNQSKRMLYVKMTGNTIYRYYDVPMVVFEELLDADSHGKYANKYIYHSYKYDTLH